MYYVHIDNGTHINPICHSQLSIMEEKMKMPGGFFDKDKLLVDKEIADPFGEVNLLDETYEFPFTESSTNRKGCIRYKLQGKTVIIVDYIYAR